jgi:hypothetical protein
LKCPIGVYRANDGAYRGFSESWRRTTGERISHLIGVYDQGQQPHQRCSLRLAVSLKVSSTENPAIFTVMLDNKGVAVIGPAVIPGTMVPARQIDG